eukprot:6803105-Pyramimonas_sp.AAC.1
MGAFVDDLTLVGSSPTPALLQEQAAAAAAIVERVVFEAGLRLNVARTFFLLRPAGPGVRAVEKVTRTRGATVSLPSGEEVAIKRTIKCLGALVDDKKAFDSVVASRTARTRGETRAVQRALGG